MFFSKLTSLFLIPVSYLGFSMVAMGAITLTGTPLLDSTGTEYNNGTVPFPSNAISQAFTIGANSNLLVVEISIRDTGGTNPGMPSTITFNGSPLTLATSQLSANQSWHNVGIYYAFFPPNTNPVSGTISGTFGGTGTFWNYSLSAFSLSGVSSSKPPVVAQADSQNTPINSLTVGGLQYGSCAFAIASSGAIAGDNGQTLMSTTGFGPSTATAAIGGNSGNGNTSNNNFLSGYVPVLAAGSTTLTATQDNGVAGSPGNKFCFAVAAFQPASPVPLNTSPAPNTPQIVGDWWQVSGNPNLGSQGNSGQQCVDFGVWQALDNTWQIWECIRGTNQPGYNRLFYNWQGATLTSANWNPVGIALEANTQYGETSGGLQAPEVFQDPTGLFHMLYGSWDNICSATSTDGKSFTRVLNSSGLSTLFGSSENNPRDPMVIRIGNLYYCYYADTSSPISSEGADYCRTSTDLINWSAPTLVAEGGQAGTAFNSAECPFVVQLAPGQFYLFRTQLYGSGAQTRVYYSTNPLDFGIDNDAGHLLCTIPYAAPEIINYQGQYYFATLLPNFNGIQICHMDWPGTPVITSNLSLGVSTGGAIVPFQVAATNGPTSFSATNLPAGLSLSSAGLITGTPQATGSFPVTLSATNAQGTASTVFTLTVSNPAPSPGLALSDSASSVTVNQGTSAASTVAISYQGGLTGTTQLSAANLPTGVTASFAPSSFTASGNTILTLTIAPTASTGTSTITINAADGSTTGSLNLPLTIGNGSTLQTNSFLATGQYLVSPSGDYYLVQQSSGNLALYSGSAPSSNPGTPVWQSYGNGSGGSFWTIMQSDGNLVTYPGTGPTLAGAPGAIWSSGTNTGNGYTLSVLDNGVIQIMSGTTLIWQEPADLPTLTSVVSMQTHAGNPLGIPLPLTGAEGVEGRIVNGSLKLVFTFDQDITAGNAEVTAGTARINGTPSFSGNSMTVNLTGVADEQNVTVSLTSLNGDTEATGAVTFGVLAGDVNHDGIVNILDLGQIRLHTSQPVTAQNCQYDINEDGLINILDLGQGRLRTGRGIR